MRLAKLGRRVKPEHNILSGYRLMWILVMFDLPVGTKKERKAANDFRFDLLNAGFERCQFSVYLKFVEGYSQVDTVAKQVANMVPDGGKVYLLFFTDKQYESILRYENSNLTAGKSSPGQYEMF